MSKDQLRGYEGEAASVYFGVFNQLILQQKKDFLFQGRSRRPPLDPVNALLSFVYTLLTNTVTSALVNNVYTKDNRAFTGSRGCLLYTSPASGSEHEAHGSQNH